MVMAVYVLCLLTSLACAVLLLRGYRSKRVSLLLWTALCFFGLAANNFVLIIDVMVGPAVDLALVRKLPAVVGAVLLLHGLIADTR
jgi:hypothetical protein